MGNLLRVEKFKFNSASLSGSLQNFGTAIQDAAIKINFINASDVACIIQNINGTFVVELPATSTLTFDESYPKNDNNTGKYYLGKGEQLQIIQVTGTGTGNIIAHIVEKR